MPFSLLYDLIFSWKKLQTCDSTFLISLSFCTQIGHMHLWLYSWFFIQELSLEGMDLSVVPAKVWESGEMIKVDLSRNSIQELPVELSSCTSLQVNLFELLIMSAQKLGLKVVKHVKKLVLFLTASFGIFQFCYSSLTFIQMLQTLILSRNKFEDWPGSIFTSLPNLLCLKLDSNPLKQVNLM